MAQTASGRACTASRLKAALRLRRVLDWKEGSLVWSMRLSIGFMDD